MSKLNAALAKFQNRHNELQTEMVELQENKARSRRSEAPQVSGSKRSRSNISAGSEDNSQSLTTGAGGDFRRRHGGDPFKVKVKVPKGSYIPRRPEPPVKGKVIKDAREYLRRQERPVTGEQLERHLNFIFADYPDMVDVLIKAEFVNYNANANTYSFKYDEKVVDKDSLLRFLRAKPFGQTLRHVKDLYSKVPEDLQKLKDEGSILILAAQDEEQQVIYPLSDNADKEREQHAIRGFDLFLSAEYLATELPRDPQELSRQYQKAFKAQSKASTATFEKVEVYKPPKTGTRKPRAWQMDKVTNAHMPELFAGTRATQIDNATY